mmetsp:Transcript_73884/g.131098  ORF Transcript_73884/g.131098 Transcript_73884/m.131098 type:complete len:399 (-) Transcript_73884:30-1226(-)
MSADKFQKGQRVKCVSEEAGILYGLTGVVDDVDSDGEPMVMFDGDDIALTYHRSYFELEPGEEGQATAVDTLGTTGSKQGIQGSEAEKDALASEHSLPIAGEYYKTLQKNQMWCSKGKRELVGHLPAASLVEVLAVDQDGWLNLLVEHGLEGWLLCTRHDVRFWQKLPSSLILKEQMERARAIQAETRKASPALITPACSTQSSKSSSAGKCDKCDGPHATECCPFFKSGREDHKDAWANYGCKNPLKMGGDAGTFVLRNARVVRQPGDGSCLFHSMAFGLREECSEDVSASALRDALMTYLEANPNVVIAGDKLEEWVQWDAGSTVAGYARRMKTEGSWGGGIEMACCSSMKGVNVHVYERCAGGFRRISCFQSAEARATIHVLYQGRMHYDALSLR